MLPPQPPLRRWVLVARRAAKWVLRVLLRRRSELLRICQATSPKPQMRAIATCLSLSRALQPEVKIFRNTPFDLAEETVQIAQRKGLNRPGTGLALASLTSCLASINAVNELTAAAKSLASKPFDSTNPNHEAMLQRLWKALMPNTRISARLSRDWGKIGFQGTDPATDFRGMGILGLQQLVYFAEKRGAEARAALADSDHEVRFYPFAVAGINITKFILELLESRNLDIKLYPILARSVHLSSAERGVKRDSYYRDSNDSEFSLPKVYNATPVGELTPLAEHALAELNELYCDLFVMANKAWASSDAAHALEWPRIYDAFKERVLQQHQPPNLQGSTWSLLGLGS